MNQFESLEARALMSAELWASMDVPASGVAGHPVEVVMHLHNYGDQVAPQGAQFEAFLNRENGPDYQSPTRFSLSRSIMPGRGIDQVLRLTMPDFGDGLYRVWLDFGAAGGYVHSGDSLITAVAPRLDIGIADVASAIATDIVAGQKLRGSVSASVSNDGEVRVNERANLRVSLVGEAGDRVELGSTRVSLNLRSGESRNFPVSINRTIPAGLEGQFRVETELQFEDDDAGNNVFLSEDVVQVEPDVRDVAVQEISSELPDSVIVGEKLNGNVRVTLSNEGASRLNERRDLVVRLVSEDGDAWVLKTAKVDLRMAPGATQTVSVKFDKAFIAATLSEGAYHIEAELETSDDHQSNNLAVGDSLSVEARTLDLSINNIDAVVKSNRKTDVTLGLENLGNVKIVNGRYTVTLTIVDGDGEELTSLTTTKSVSLNPDAAKSVKFTLPAMDADLVDTAAAVHATISPAFDDVDSENDEATFQFESSLSVAPTYRKHPWLEADLAQLV